MVARPRAHDVAYDLAYDVAYDLAYHVDGTTFVGRLALPPGEGPVPGVLIAPEANGLDDEQAAPVGLREVVSDWPGLARRSVEHVIALVERIERNPRPLRTIKDAAYAWRQTVFYLSLTDPSEYDQFTASTDGALRGGPEHVEVRLRPALEGLCHVMNGGTLDRADGTNGRRFQGWVVGQHWMLADQAARDDRTSAV